MLPVILFTAFLFWDFTYSFIAAADERAELEDGGFEIGSADGYHLPGGFAGTIVKYGYSAHRWKGLPEAVVIFVCGGYPNAVYFSVIFFIAQYEYDLIAHINTETAEEGFNLPG